MERAQIEEKVLKILNEHILDIDVSLDDKLIDKGFDSLDKIEVCMKIEKEFGIIIDDDFLLSERPSNMTARQVIDYVEKLL